MAYITKKKLINPKEFEIFDEDKDYFWTHHGWRIEEKEHLRYLAHILPSAAKKKQKGLQLNDDEEYSYHIFIEKGPDIGYSAYFDEYGIGDGRHRMYMLREENIQLEMRVGCCIDFSDVFKHPKEYFKFFFTRNKRDKSLILVKPCKNIKYTIDKYVKPFLMDKIDLIFR